MIPKSQLVDLYPLDTFIEARFADSDDVDDFDSDARVRWSDAQWTEELRSTVAEFLHQLSDELYETLLQDLVETEQPVGDTRDEQIGGILVGFKPFEVWLAAHAAAVLTTPRLDQLILSFAVPSRKQARDVLDVGEWLDKHATNEQPITFIGELDPAIFTQFDEQSRDELYAADWLGWAQSEGRNISLSQLLHACQAVTQLNTRLKPAMTERSVVIPSRGVMRSWAREHGYNVSDRGRIPVAIVETYRASLEDHDWCHRGRCDGVHREP